MADPKKVLIIDDDPNILMFCRTVLGFRGYIVRTAGSVDEGFSMAEVERPDLMILDIIMEEVDSGLKLAVRLAALLPGTPIIMLSSIADACGKVFDTSGLPVVAMIDKPIHPKVLLEMVEGIFASTG